MTHEEGAELRAPLLGGFVQRGESPLVDGVHTRAVLDEQRRDVDVLQQVIPKPFDNEPGHSTCCHLATGAGTKIRPVQ